MATQLDRVGWLLMYMQMRMPTSFLSSRFTVKPGGIFQGEKVAMDIQRFDEDVAVAVTAYSGANLNDISEFTTKEFTPPAYGESFPLNVNELVERMAGVDPYTAAYKGYAAEMVSKMAKGFMVIDAKIQRAIEVQASQILQNGKLVLTNSAGATIYEIDFKPKASHFPTAGTDWDAAGATPITDIASVATAVRTDGKVNSNRLTFGDSAWSNFMANAQVQAHLDNRRIEFGFVDPEMEESGAVNQGRIWIGSYYYDMWTYPEEYKSPQTGLPVPYIDTDNVVIDSTKTRYDMVSAKVPLPLGPDPRVAGLVPGRLSDRASGLDVTPNVYCTANGKQIIGELESRPLLLPVAIDGFGCIKTIA